IDLITDPKGLGISPKRITVSTVGIAKMIKRLGDDKVKFNLALSLHAANDKKRSSIMPINEQNSLDQLLEALAYFYEKTKTRITYEYILLEDFNDGPEDAIELANFTQKIPSKVNIIEYNEISGARFKRASGNRMHYFKERLDRMGVISNVRRSRGKDIDAACGQLANKTKKAVPGP
ncbi:MAG: 23S rRNA (adenine(2503)-C(2))-methyltransferase RlmN, partial [Bacteroidetes bacterium]|nr:23S rRNA (adenine(2503)-C(2))-methyltransferase RlmN [Bacteroidota bacterium]